MVTILDFPGAFARRFLYPFEEESLRIRARHRRRISELEHTVGLRGSSADATVGWKKISIGLMWARVCEGPHPARLQCERYQSSRNNALILSFFPPLYNRFHGICPKKNQIFTIGGNRWGLSVRIPVFGIGDSHDHWIRRGSGWLDQEFPPLGTFPQLSSFLFFSFLFPFYQPLNDT